MLWGGRFNPILAVDDAAHVKWLAELFHVDALYAVELENDARPAVREWAASTVHALQEMADREEQREAEDRLER